RGEDDAHHEGEREHERRRRDRLSVDAQEPPLVGRRGRGRGHRAVDHGVGRWSKAIGARAVVVPSAVMLVAIVSSFGAAASVDSVTVGVEPAAAPPAAYAGGVVARNRASGGGRLDWGAGRYEDTAADLFGAARAVVEHADIRPGERVLDVGCGTGN